MEVQIKIAQRYSANEQKHYTAFTELKKSELKV